MEARASRHGSSFGSGLPDLPPSGCGTTARMSWTGSTRSCAVWTVLRPKPSFKTDEMSTPRTNVYGILRASPLADGKVCCGYVGLPGYNTDDSGENSGLSLGLALLKYLSRAKWLAKDVILLAADDGYLDGSDEYAPGTEAWLQAYHLDPIESGLQGGLSMRAGVIRAAVNLETLYDSRHVDSVGIYTAGMNGQLPNLDLVNTAVRAFRQHQIPTILDRADVQQDGEHKSYVSRALEFVSSLSEEYTPPEFKERARNYLTNLKGMLHFMTTLATGPSGPHANFISYNIDSITLSLTKSQTSGGRPLASRDVLRSIEMVVRALSNLEEKLHHGRVHLRRTSGNFAGDRAFAVPGESNYRDACCALFTVFLVVETLCVLLLVGISKNFATPTALLQTFSSSNTSATRWFGLAIAISVTQALTILVVMPTLRSVAGFSGCVEIYDWRKKVTTYEAEEQSKLLQESTKATEKTVVDTKPDANNDIPKLDSGWRAIKFFTMAVIVYAHCIMGILNYPMALFCAIPMAHFARVVPFGTATLPKNVWNGLWLFLSSPLVLLILLNWSLSVRRYLLAWLYDCHHADLVAFRVNLLALRIFAASTFRPHFVISSLDVSERRTFG
ncbi:GPI transamidase component Gaa1 [Phytophthora cactorum]|nr:GPI transamidase component Gaa1 [Phytophthora cactorum]